MKRVIKHFQKIRNDQSGSMYVEFLGNFFLTMVVVVTLVSFFNLAVKHQQATTIARQIARSIEVTGVRDSSTNVLFNQLCANAGMTGATYDLIDIQPPLLGGGRIQLRSHFTVRVRVPMRFHVAQPGDVPIEIPFTIETRATGMSEVYWK